jgi:hypothetical protein
MKTTHPHLAKELIGNPEEIMAGTGKKLRWKCQDCKYIWVTQGNYRVKGRGCPKCAKGGFDPSKPAFFYLVHRPGQFKIGIAAVDGYRLDTHKRNGWWLIEKVTGLGDSIALLELSVKRGLRKANIPTGSKAFRGTFDGHTEAWNSVDLEVSSIRDLCEKLGVPLAV